jgi:hypothetical protein
LLSVKQQSLADIPDESQFTVRHHSFQQSLRL